MAAWLEQLHEEGYSILPSVFTPMEIESARHTCATALAQPDVAPSVLRRGDGPPHGARNLLQIWPQAAALANAPALAQPLRRVLGTEAGLVRGLYFDKPPGGDWALPWHRDLTVAVRRHGALGAFTKPTVKAGVTHVEAPTEILTRMLTARIHLDAMTDENGPLRVIPGSHERLDSAAASERAAVTLHCQAGDVLLMRPLLLHASGHASVDSTEHRRVVHLEFAPNRNLPDGYEWHSFIPLRPSSARHAS